MAAKVFVLMKIAASKNKDVVSVLKQVEGVKSIDTVTGPYDAIATIERETLNDIGELITTKIHPGADITKMVTYLVI